MKSKFGQGRTRASHKAATLTAIAAALGCVLSSAHAVETESGNGDFRLRFDNTVRYNLGMRINNRDTRIANTPTADEGDFKFDNHDIVTDRLDLLSELEGAWGDQFGFRVSATAWGDQAYHDISVKRNPALTKLASSYTNDTYSSLTKRYYRGISGEILDAFVYSNFTVAGRSVNVKAGSHTVYWGNAVFTQGGISYSQQPIDGRKGAANPGTETRELFLPLTQVSAQSQVTDWLSLAGQYYLDWDHVRSPEGGTYLGGTDLVLDGPDRAGSGLPFTRTEALGPDRKRGNWGVNAKVLLSSLNASTLGLYYREFDEKNGLWLFRNPANPLTYRAVFPRGTKLLGLSVDTTIAAFSVGAELVLRKNAGLNSASFAAVNEGARGDVQHLVLNTIYGLPRSPLWDTGSLVAELTYDHLDKVKSNEALFNREGSVLCPLGRNAGCATKTAIGVGLSFTPQYPAVFPGVDLSIPITLQGGIKGNTPDFGGTSEGNWTYSAGAELDFNKKWTARLSWADARARIIPGATPGTYTGNGGWQTIDRGRVVLTLKASF